MRCIPLLLCLALSGLTPAAEPPVPPAPADPNETVCSVNGERIRRQDVEDRMPAAIVKKLAELRRRLMVAGRPETEAQDAVDGLQQPVYRQTLREVVRERVMLQEARRRKLQINDLLAGETFEREWEALKARQLAGTPGYEEKAVRERARARLLLQAFRAQDDVRGNEDAWFREALKRSEVVEGGPGGTPMPLAFFFPGDAVARPARTPGADRRASDVPAERP